MMCSYVTCFSYIPSLLQKTQGRREETQTRTWYLEKLHFPKELIPVVIISITVFSKIHHQRTLSHPWDAETHGKLWRGKHITWQRDGGHKAASARRKHKASEDAGRSRYQAVAPHPDLQSRHWCQKHRHYLLRHPYAASNTTLCLGLWLPQQYIYYKTKKCNSVTGTLVDQNNRQQLFCTYNILK